MFSGEVEKPICSIDAVMFRIFTGKLEVALVQRPQDARVYAGAMALPGGFVHVDKDQTLSDTLFRNLEKKVGLTPAYIVKLAFDGNISRDPQGWSITCPYLCFINQASSESDLVEWIPVANFFQSSASTSLPFDHLKLINDGFDRLYNRAKYSTEPNFFLHQDFTLTELQQVYEAILGKALHKKNFRDRIEESNSVEMTGETKIVKRSRAQLYRNKSPLKPHFFSRVLQGAFDER